MHTRSRFFSTIWLLLGLAGIASSSCGQQEAGVARQTGGQAEQAAPECQEAGASGPESVVRTLYERYPAGGRKVIENEPEAVLRMYFDDKLAGLFVRDHECKVREQGVCRLDASTMYDSQDPGAGDLRVCAMDPVRHTVAVHFWGGGPERTTVTYLLIRTASGWRISNMLYARGRPIVDALSAKR